VATVPPDAPGPSATADVSANSAAPRRRWRIPTSIVVTFLGIALTAWLLPAFTRQWDDRQKANELKARLVQEIAAAAPVELQMQDLWITALIYERRKPKEIARSMQDFFRSDSTIKAELRAYFPSRTIHYAYERGRRRVSGSRTVDSDAVQAWRAYANAVYAFYDLELVLGWPRLVTARFATDHKIEGEDRLYTDFLRIIDPSKRAEETAATWVEWYSPWRKKPQGTAFALSNVAGMIPLKQQQAAEQVLAAKPRGYSTTPSDLIDELVPF
jgi:hypothetical protein